MSALRRDRHRQRRRRRHARPPPRARPASGSCCSSAATGCRASRRTGTPRTSSSTTATSRRTPGTTRDGKPFQPQVHYFVGGATKLYGAALYRLRAEDFGELRHHDGVSPAWPISYDEFEPYYTQAEQLYQVHGARGEDPTEPPRERALPVPGGLATSRASSSSPTTSRAAGLPPVPRALRRHARRGRTCRTAAACAARPATASRASCTRSPTPRCSRVRPALEHPNVTLLDQRRGGASSRPTTPGTAVTERRRRARRRDARRYSADLVVVVLRGREHGEAAARVGQRQAPQRARQRLRPGRAQLHVPQQPGRARAVEGGEPDRLPEDARAQRLLLRRPTTSTTRSGNIQMVGKSSGARCTAARSRCETKLAPDADARATSPATRSTSGSRPRTCRGRTTASRSTATAASTLALHARPTRSPKQRLYHELKSMLGHLGMHHDHLIPRHAYLKNDIPVAGVAHQAGTCRFGTDPATLGARHRLQGARARQPLRRRHELLPEHRRGQPGADRDGERAARRRPPARAPGRARDRRRAAACRLSDRPHVVDPRRRVRRASAARASWPSTTTCDVTLVDRNNYHQFQPLLYQVATSQLAPSDIAYSLRKLFHDDAERRRRARRGRRRSTSTTAHVTTTDGRRVAGDALVLAAGLAAELLPHRRARRSTRSRCTRSTTRSRLRSRILGVFEDADRDPSLIDHGALNFVVVGGGPTGVELAGALADLIARDDDRGVPRPRGDGRAGAPRRPRARRCSAPFSDRAHDYVAKVLERKGVRLHLGVAVTEVGARPRRRSRDGTTIRTRCVVWGGGIMAPAVAAARRACRRAAAAASTSSPT